MKITRANHIQAEGTCLQGYIHADYQNLVAAFGPPMPGDMFKVDAEWIVKIGDLVATIYNWKDGRNYLGPDGAEPEHIRHWHIGGHKQRVVAYVLANVKGASRE